ncbi:hypothetical protein [Roseomonas sp. BN140053]|uniref:hypothetical protein n=1 Tax=Roseomonas sp. BN140053 TaxID=3391898 RepID=UPI0039EA4153
MNLMRTVNPAARTGAASIGRSSNPQLDNNERRAAQEAVRLAVEEVAIMPLFQRKSIWATRAGLRMEARMDDCAVAVGVFAVKP